MVIEAYNSSYPLSYYSVGTVYAFYSTGITGAMLASPQYISKYSQILDKLRQDEDNRIIKPVGGAVATKKGNLSRYYGVVVEIERVAKGGYIKIMFTGNTNGIIQYFTRRYAVSYGCSTDGKDLMPTTATIQVESTTKNIARKGSITHLSESDKPGGITHLDSTKKNSANRPNTIGGITHMGTNERSNASGRGGITHIDKRGGITHIDQ